MENFLGKKCRPTFQKLKRGGRGNDPLQQQVKKLKPPPSSSPEGKEFVCVLGNISGSTWTAARDPFPAHSGRPSDGPAPLSGGSRKRDSDDSSSLAPAEGPRPEPRDASLQRHEEDNEHALRLGREGRPASEMIIVRGLGWRKE